MRSTGLVTLAIAFISAAFAPAGACTLFSASGSASGNGGVLIAKNRDWSADSYTSLELKYPSSGHMYLALVADGKTKGGVNDAGFAIVSASASSLGKGERALTQGPSGGSGSVLAAALSGYASVDDALAAKGKLFGAHAAFYLLADREESAWVEVSPDGRIASRRAQSGILVHTNHYLDPELAQWNEKKRESSLARFDRATALLGAKASFTLEDFIGIAGDRSAGPEDSIWRVGGAEGERTLATFALALERDGSVELYTRLANSGEEEKTLRFKLGPDFWAQGSAASQPFVGARTPTKIVILRHGEKPEDERNHNLSAAGLERSLSLPSLLLRRYGRPAAIFAPAPVAPKASGIRSLETIVPTAVASGVNVDTSFGVDDVAALASRIAGDKGFAGKTVFIAWEHERIPAIVAALGVSDAGSWKGTDFDGLWVVELLDGRAWLVREREGLGGRSPSAD